MGTGGTTASLSNSPLSSGIDRFLHVLSSSLPSIASVLAVLAVGAVAVYLVGRIAEAVARNAAVPNVKAVGRSFRAVVSIIVLLVASDRLGFGDSLLGTIILITVGAVFLAVAIAFGLGALALARRTEEDSVADITAKRPERPEDHP